MSWMVTTVGSTFTNGAVPTPWWTTSRCRRRAIAASQVCSAAILKGRRLELQGASTTSATVSMSGCAARKPCIATTTRSWPQVPTARTRLVSSASEPPTSPGSRKRRFTPMRMAKNNTSPHEDRLRRRAAADPPQVRRYRWILPQVLKRCAVVLTPSETVAEQVSSELAFPRDRIVVTPEGVRRSALDPGSRGTATPTSGPASSPAGPARDGRSYLLFTGAREPRKNLDRLLRAFARVL